MLEVNLSRTRREAVALCKKHRCLLLTTNSIRPEERQAFEDRLKNLPTLPRRQLSSLIPRLRSDLHCTEKHFGFRGQYSELEKLLPTDPEDSEKIVFVLKHHLAHLFDHYERALGSYGE